MDDNAKEAGVEFEYKVSVLVDGALLEMERKYGYKGEKPKQYHNADHARQAIDAAERIAAMAGITNHEKGLLKIAMAYHDIDTDSGKKNEENSAAIAEREMRAFGFKEEDILAVTEMILATRVSFEGEVMMQMVDSDDERIKLLKQIAADADLSGLGRPWEEYFTSAVSLGREQGKNTNSKEFWASQVSFLAGLVKRGYYTEAARRQFPRMKNNLEDSMEQV